MGVEAAQADNCERFADLLAGSLNRSGPFLIELMICGQAGREGLDAGQCAVRGGRIVSRHSPTGSDARPMKTQVLEAIGEVELRPLAQLDAALAANDRVKYCFTLLQMALAHADHPDQPAVTLKRERLSCGVDEPALDDVIAATQAQGTQAQRQHYRMPGYGLIRTHIATDMQVMAAPVLAAGKAGYAERLQARLAALPPGVDDIVDGTAIADMTRTARHRDTHKGKARDEDSLHQLVMDLHKELNALQAALAEEVLDGAAVYNLTDADHPRVQAFMAGLNRTAELKFNHPGLGTTAMRSGERLVIQNDIGTTDAHVIVIHVEGLSVTITCTDVHLERLAFFRQMLARRAVSWNEGHTEQSAVVAAGRPFHLAVGTYPAVDEEDCRAYLEFLGSRLVFLIDWNRARKQLRGFLRGAQRLEVLAWAAENQIGHRGFLELGGARLINQAIEATAGTAMHFGDRLCDVIGEAQTVSFVHFVLLTATEGLRAHSSRSLIGDRIAAELRTLFSGGERQLLGVASDHAGLIFEIASLVRDGVLAAMTGETDLGKLARRAQHFEHDADQLVIAAREAVRLRPDYAAFLNLLEAADDVADQLEDVAFLLSLLAEGKADGTALDALQTLADVVMEAVQEWVKSLGHAAHLKAPGSREDTDDFLIAIDRVAELEHQADDAERALTKAAVKQARDFRQLHLYAAIGAGLEASADALKYASDILRDHVLGNGAH